MENFYIGIYADINASICEFPRVHLSLHDSAYHSNIDVLHVRWSMPAQLLAKHCTSYRPAIFPGSIHHTCDLCNGTICFLETWIIVGVKLKERGGPCWECILTDKGYVPRKKGHKQDHLPCPFQYLFGTDKLLLKPQNISLISPSIHFVSPIKIFNTIVTSTTCTMYTIITSTICTKYIMSLCSIVILHILKMLQLSDNI